MIEELKLKWTGERLVTEIYNEDTIYHLHRYALCLNYISDKIVVDIASGEGYGSNLIAKKANKVYGIDISENAVSFAKNKYKETNNLTFIVGSVDSVPLENNLADVIVSFETLEHTDKHDEMMKEIKRVLKPNGLLIMSSPDKAFYSDQYNRSNPFHIKELYFNEYKNLLNKYFKFSSFYNQSFLTGSFIIKETYSGSSFTSFEGNYHQISSNNGLKNPLFNISFSSDEIISEPQTSFFNGEETIREMYFNRVMNFTPYKLGESILKPFRLLKKLLNRK